MRTHVTLESMGALIEGVHNNPFELLGPHPIQQDGRTALAVRAYLPDTQQAWVLDPAHAETRPMRRIHPAGLYEAICPVPEDENQRYQFRVADNDGEVTTMHDPYAFSSHLTEFDFYLLGEGRHERIYDKLGAQIRTVDGVTGTNFAVWAPNATAISVVGEFNRWDTRRHPMRKHFPSGIWELFIPEVGAGQQYKFRAAGRGWQHHRQDRSHGVRGGVATPHGFDRGRSITVHLDRPGLDGTASQPRCAESADFHLRSPSGQLASVE